MASDATVLPGTFHGVRHREQNIKQTKRLAGPGVIAPRLIKPELIKPEFIKPEFIGPGFIKPGQGCRSFAEREPGLGVATRRVVPLRFIPIGGRERRGSLGRRVARAGLFAADGGVGEFAIPRRLGLAWRIERDAPFIDAVFLARCDSLFFAIGIDGELGELAEHGEQGERGARVFSASRAARICFARRSERTRAQRGARDAARRRLTAWRGDDAGGERGRIATPSGVGRADFGRAGLGRA